ncbi:PD-(D/E)XK nuclease family protein [Priestia flexa]|nr:hypothetical protein D1859_16765 [Priestia flexa]
MLQKDKDVILMLLANPPRFFWSLARHNQMIECPRKYAYQYYFSHHGWLSSSTELAKQAYRLKKIVTLPLLVGQAVKQAIRNYSFTTNTESIEEHMTAMRNFIDQELRRAYLQTRDHGDDWYHEPNVYTMMLEYYQKGYLADYEIQQTKTSIERCVTSFFRSKTFRELQSIDLIQILPQEAFCSVELNSVKIFVSLDLLYHKPTTNEYIIVNWQTGKQAHDHLTQLALCAFYIQQTYNVPLNVIQIRNEYLYLGGSHTYYVTAKEIDAFHHTIKESLMNMHLYIEHSEYNQPKPLSAFPMKQSTRCKQCVYQELCEKTD